MGCNVLAVAPRKVIMIEGNLITQKRLETEGVDVHTYNGTEISIKGSGGPTCLTRPFLRSASMSYENQFTAHTQLKLSPFFQAYFKVERISGMAPLVRISLAATNYELHHENEYFAIRTKAALLDITPLKKYIIEGPDAQVFLNRLVTRNIGHLQSWAGYVYSLVR